jgi:aminoglycoside 2'-N-acetyltransferase I
MTPDGVRRTPDSDGHIYVLSVSVPVDVSGELVCDFRPASLW